MWCTPRSWRYRSSDIPPSYDLKLQREKPCGPIALIEKRRGLPRCSWFDWLHTAPQHLVNHYKVLCKGVGLILQTKPHIPCRKLRTKFQVFLLFFFVYSRRIKCPTPESGIGDGSSGADEEDRQGRLSEQTQSHHRRDGQEREYPRSVC